MGKLNDTGSVIDQLRIDRTQQSSTPRSYRSWWIAGIALVAAGGAAAGFTWMKQEAHPARLAAAAPAPAAAPAAAARLPDAALEASGYVVANRQATVAAKIIGRLETVQFEEGQHVKAGQVLATLDDTNAVAALKQAQAQLELARLSLKGKEAQWEISRRLLDRQKELLASGWVSRNAVDSVAATAEAQFNEAMVARGQMAVSAATVDAAQRAVDDTVVRAPFDGVVTVKAAQPGEIISPSSGGGGFTRTGICTLVDMGSLEVDVDVSENFINRITKGQAATITLNAYRDWQIPAEVIAVVPTADRNKATVGVRLALKEKDPRVLPQMGVNVRFLNKPAAGGIAGAATGSIHLADRGQGVGGRASGPAMPN
jgi:RND family efflux transporter MFP subunit